MYKYITNMSESENETKIVNWFFDNYIECENRENNCITMKELYTDFRYSTFYRSLPTNQKRGFTKRKFETMLLSDLKVRKFHRFRKKINNKHLSNFFMGIKCKSA